MPAPNSTEPGVRRLIPWLLMFLLSGAALAAAQST
jgi:hypothetical protein